MRRKLFLFVCLLFCVLTAGCASVSSPEERQPVKIVIASDLHYLSQELTDNGALFHKIAAQGDGKLILDIEEITDTFIWQMLKEKPDLVILSGDLCFNGEYQSHLDLADKLNRLTDHGIAVLVIPGNHDIGRSCYSFSGDTYAEARPTLAGEFWEIYHNFGPAQASTIDVNSGSYVYEASDDLRIIMLDTNSFSSNFLPVKSLTWLEQQLRDAKKAGARVITVSHQNLLVHNSMFVFGYQIANAEDIENLLSKYKVLLHLSGHMHIQHYLDHPFPEILTSPLSMAPCRYGLLSWDGRTLQYRAESLNVSAWASEQGSTDEKLLHFEPYARDFFCRCAFEKTVNASAAAKLPPETAQQLADCFAAANLSYFTGEAIDRASLRSGLELWAETLGEGFETAYLRSILEDTAPDPLFVELRAK